MLLLNRKAYTLSQFILLWILGILFVILVCLNVLRYRATAHAQEAEALLQEVRAEQEDRCAFGRKYAVYDKHLKAFRKRKAPNAHFRYDLSSGQGISAHHKLLDFKLQMPSYADGRICCDNCDKLNRYYIRCNVLQKSKNFVPADPDCIAYVPGKKGNQGTRKDLQEQNTSKTREAVRPIVKPTEKFMGTGPESVVQPDMPTLPKTDPQAAEGGTVAVQPQSAGELVTKTDVTIPPVKPEQKEGQTVDAKIAKPETLPPSSVRKCKIPPQGEFFIDGCEVYQSGTRGSVVHTWNFEKCAYEITQTCVIPSYWKQSSNTKAEKGLYPSDLDDYCPQLLKSAPCPNGGVAGRECGTVGAVCYKNCQITQQEEVKESALVVLYDVQIQIDQLQCMPSREVTVKVP